MIGYALLLCVENAVSYWFIRNMIYTIVWCDQKRRHCSIRAFRKRFSKWQLIRMRCLEQYTNAHRKNFRFWIKIKDCFVIFEACAFVLLVMINFLPTPHPLNYIPKIIVTQSTLITVIMVFQTDINRNTKYDRIRLNRIHK